RSGQLHSSRWTAIARPSASSRPKRTSNSMVGATTRSMNLASFTSHTLLSRIYGWLFLISADRQQSCMRRLMSRRRLLTVLVSGSPTVEARRIVALSVETSSGTALLAPVLVRQSNPKQRVTFDHENPSRFTRKRCDEIGCATDVATEAERGCVPPPVSGEASV